jgi:hypothetical protein
MSFFLAFPEYLCFEMLYDWFDLEDVDRLDSAVCNKSERNLLLSVLSNPDLILKSNGLSSQFNRVTFTSISFMGWVFARKISFERLIVTGLNFDGKQLKFNIIISKIRSLSLQCCTRNELAVCGLLMLINSCVMLSSLIVDTVESMLDDCVLQINPDILNQLRVFSVKKCGLSSASFLHISSHCKHLNTFEVGVGSSGIVGGFHDVNLENELIRLVTNNPHLEKIQVCSAFGGKHDFCFTNLVLNTITEICVNLQILELEGCLKVTGPALLNLFKKHGDSLRTVRIKYKAEHEGVLYYILTHAYHVVVLGGGFHIFDQLHPTTPFLIDLFSCMKPLRGISFHNWPYITPHLLREITELSKNTLERIMVVVCEGFQFTSELKNELHEISPLLSVVGL